MDRTGLTIALGIAALVGVVFGLYPELDLKIAAPFTSPQDQFPLRFVPSLGFLRDGAMWVVALIAAVPGFALIAKLLFPRMRLLVPSRAILLMLATLAI